MGVHIYLPNVVVLRLLVADQRAFGTLPIAFRCMRKSCRQRSANLVQALMFHKNCVIQTIEHAEGSQRDAAKDQQFSRFVHRATPDRESRLPVCRSTPTSIPTSAITTMSPPTSAMPPATSPSFNSSKTKMGKIAEPASSTCTQRRRQLSLRKTYGWMKDNRMASIPNSMM